MNQGQCPKPWCSSKGGNALVPSVLSPWAYWGRAENEESSRVSLIEHHYAGICSSGAALSHQLSLQPDEPSRWAQRDGVSRGLQAQLHKHSHSGTREDASPRKTPPSPQLPGASCQGCRDTLPGRTSSPGGSQQHRSPASPAGAQRQNGISSKALLPSQRNKESDTCASPFSA